MVARPGAALGLAGRPRRCWPALTRIQGVFLVLPDRLGGAGRGRPDAWRPWRELAAARRSTGGARARGGHRRRSARPSASSRFLVYSAASSSGRRRSTPQDAWGGKEFFPPWEVIGRGLALDDRAGRPAAGPQPGAAAPVRGPAASSGSSGCRSRTRSTRCPQFVLLATRIQPTPLTSTNRYLLVIFPAFVVLALIPWPRVRLAWAHHVDAVPGLLLREFLAGDVRGVACRRDDRADDPARRPRRVLRRGRAARPAGAARQAGHRRRRARRSRASCRRRATRRGRSASTPRCR